MNENLTRAQRRQLKRERKHAKLNAQKTTNRTKMILNWTIPILILIVVIIWYSSRPAPLPSNEVRVPLMGQEHTNNVDDVVYNSNPPTSGPHFSDWHKEWTFYDKELPIGGLLHNMEHGGVVIFFQPDLAQDQKDLIEEFVGNKWKTIAGTKADIPSSIAMASWGVYEYFNQFDEIRMKDFYKRNLNNSPENIYP